MGNTFLSCVGIVAGIIVLSNLDSMLGLALAAFIAYIGLYFYRKGSSGLGKLFWGLVIFFSLLHALSNMTAIVGVLALIAVIYVWKEWEKKEENDDIIEHQPSKDPFENFDKEWEKLNRSRTQ